MIVKRAELLNSRPVWLKFIFNDNGIIFSSGSVQHRDVTSDIDVRYADSGGNALAGTISEGKVQIRGNGALNYSETRVKTIWSDVLKSAGNEYLSSLKAEYMGVNIYSPNQRQL